MVEELEREVEAGACGLRTFERSSVCATERPPELGP